MNYYHLFTLSLSVKRQKPCLPALLAMIPKPPVYRKPFFHFWELRLACGEVVGSDFADTEPPCAFLGQNL